MLDAMGVMYRARDDVAELLVPFVQRHRPSIPASEVTARYTEASLGRMDADAFWRSLGLSPGVEDDYLSAHRLTDGVLSLRWHETRTLTCGACRTTCRGGPSSSASASDSTVFSRALSSAATSATASHPRRHTGVSWTASVRHRSYSSTIGPATSPPPATWAFPRCALARAAAKPTAWQTSRNWHGHGGACGVVGIDRHSAVARHWAVARLRRIRADGRRTFPQGSLGMHVKSRFAACGGVKAWVSGLRD